MPRPLIGWIFATCVTLSYAMFTYAVYPKVEMGYSAEYRAELDEKIANTVPLFVADVYVGGE